MMLFSAASVYMKMLLVLQGKYNTLNHTIDSFIAAVASN